MWKTFFGCHVYIILSTAIVDNCVDKSVVFLAFTYSLFCGIIMHNTYFISRKINFTKAKLVIHYRKDLIILKILKGIGVFLLYLAMFLLVCVFFTGNGAFIYEAF